MKFDFSMSRAEYDDIVFGLTDEEREVLDLRRRGGAMPTLPPSCIAASAR